METVMKKFCVRKSDGIPYPYTEKRAAKPKFEEKMLPVKRRSGTNPVTGERMTSKVDDMSAADRDDRFPAPGEEDDAVDRHAEAEEAGIVVDKPTHTEDELSAMDKHELVAYAEEQGVVVDKRMNAQSMRETILEALNAAG